MLASLALLLALVYPGHGVLTTGEQQIAAYAQVGPVRNGATHIDVWETTSGRTIRTYDRNMTKLIHMIIVSDDLRDFRHIHPTLQANGHFTIDAKLAAGTPYHIYIDGDPHKLGRQVFRFDIPPVGSNSHVTPSVRSNSLVIPSAGSKATRVEGRGAAYPQRKQNQSAPVARAGPYTVRLDTTAISPGEIDTLRITISKNGKPATDLHPYLGAMAHGVFVGMNDLAYMHGHGMSEQMLEMETANDCGDSMMASMPSIAPTAPVPAQFVMQVLAPSAQRYDFWLQFVGGNTLYTVPFLITTG